MPDGSCANANNCKLFLMPSFLMTTVNCLLSDDRTNNCQLSTVNCQLSIGTRTLLQSFDISFSLLVKIPRSQPTRPQSDDEFSTCHANIPDRLREKSQAVTVDDEQHC
ncbi:MAG: hypothetical protein HC942_21270 [Microcoleus sp. SU_5_6]|nr:hypothetical protein [Microcoleus sp. SU_5_6]NJL67611.1 hypothetical protein [Microcoleus sp. SM1_3_4]